jgi:hypothetical protein
LAIVVLVLVKEPVRGSNDIGFSSTKGVQGKSGVKAYFEDVLYCLRKSVEEVYSSVC